MYQIGFLAHLAHYYNILAPIGALSKIKPTYLAPFITILLSNAPKLAHLAQQKNQLLSMAPN
jgi:hypothetical protein